MDARTDESLLVAAKGGDKEALGELLLRHGPVVRAGLQINPKWQSVLEPNDVMQVTYFEAFEQIDRFTGNGPSFRRWLRRIANNNLRDAIQAMERAKRPHPDKRVERTSSDESPEALFGLFQEGGATPSRHAAMNEVRALLESEIERLPTDYRTVIKQHFLDGHSVSEIAKEMGRTSGAVHLLRIRALRKLETIMGTGSRFFSFSRPLPSKSDS